MTAGLNAHARPATGESRVVEEVEVPVAYISSSVRSPRENSVLPRTRNGPIWCGSGRCATTEARESAAAADEYPEGPVEGASGHPWPGAGDGRHLGVSHTDQWRSIWLASQARSYGGVADAGSFERVPDSRKGASTRSTVSPPRTLLTCTSDCQPSISSDPPGRFVG